MDRRDRLYQQVANRLRDAMDAGSYAERLPTENELVDQFEVSLTTIKKALSLLVEEGRIVRISGKGTFPTTSALASGDRSDRAESPKTVGFLIPVLPDEFSRRLLKGVTERLAKDGVYPVIGLTAPDSGQEAEVIRRMRDLGVEGLIICPLERELYNEEILRLKLDRFPFLLVDRRLPGIETSYVIGDGRGLTRQAVEHLVSLGHERIALAATSLRPQLTQSLAERIEGFQEAMRDHGLDGDEIWTVSESPTPEAEAWTMIKQRLLSGVTAVIGTTTLDTVLIWRAAEAVRIRIPEDLSLVGFDYSGIVDSPGIDLAPAPAYEMLTWLDQSEEAMGNKAAELILEVIADPSALPCAVVPGVFHPGGTTAEARSGQITPRIETASR